MEVHAHAHTERKKWTHYLWEFLMLFLAVFCGFLAENIREHSVEKQREKEYMVALIKDLQSDITGLKDAAGAKMKRIVLADSINYLFEKGDFKNTSADIYFLGAILGFRSYFSPNDGTIQQLKNAGGLRLIKKRDVVDSLQRYTSFMQEFLKLQELEETQLEEYRKTMSTVFDATVLNKMVPGNGKLNITKPAANPGLMTDDRQKINDLNMKILLVKSNRMSQLEYFMVLNNYANSLIDQVKKEYHIQ
jgi:hypothetical protein